MKITENASLKALNTFNISINTKQLIEIESVNDILEIYKKKLLQGNSTYILGGGSNILFTKNYSGTLLHSGLMNITIEEESKEYVIVRCGSGVNWDWFVNYCTDRNWGGIENLSDIPGNIGASPVQNIGAYGVEAKDAIIKVEGIDYLSGEPFAYTNAECGFEYRNSIFKQRPSYFITDVSYRLTKKPELIINYGSVEKELNNYKERNIRTLRQAIIKIRRSKLPSVDELGSAGSFFKNPVVNPEVSNDLLSKYPELPVYDMPNGTKKKLSAAWLIDTAGLKGIRKGDVGTYPTQPLVIVNYGQALGKEIVEFSENIQKIVLKKFNVELTPEVIFK